MTAYFKKKIKILKNKHKVIFLIKISINNQIKIKIILKIHMLTIKINKH